MKKIYVMVLALSVLGNIAYGKEAETEDKWVGVLWQNGEEPIVLPVLANSEKECKELLNKINEIAKNTVKIDRKLKCQRVMTK